jgi:hypothetical protein
MPNSLWYSKSLQFEFRYKFRKLARKLGVLAVDVAIVYSPDATLLSEYPEATAMEFKVSVTEIVTGPVYRVLEVVGVLPSVV